MSRFPQSYYIIDIASFILLKIADFFKPNGHYEHRSPAILFSSLLQSVKLEKFRNQNLGFSPIY